MVALASAGHDARYFAFLCNLHNFHPELLKTFYTPIFPKRLDFQNGIWYNSTRVKGDGLHQKERKKLWKQF